MRYQISIYGDESGFTVQYFCADPYCDKEFRVVSLADVKPTPEEMENGR